MTKSKLDMDDKFINFLLVLILIIFGFLFFFKEGVVTSGDSCTYLNQGLRIFKGLGYTYLQRGPIFPLFIAGSFYLFGVSVKNAFFVVRLFFVLNIVAIFLLTLRLYGRRLAIIVSLLIITSFGINQLSEYLLPDTVVPFFMLLFIYVLYKAFNKKRAGLFIASGICLGISLLVKEVSIVLIPLPILLIIMVNEYRDKQHLASGLLLYLTTSIIILLWVVFILLKNGSINQLVSLGGPLYLKELFPYGSGERVSFYQYISNIFTKLKVYYNTHVKMCSFYLAPLFLLSWIYLIIRSMICRNKEDLLLLSFGICILPLLISVGGVGTRLGQTGIYVIISYVVISKFIFSFISFVYSKFEHLISHKTISKFGKPLIIIITIIFLVGLQLFMAPRPSIDIFTGKRGFANASFLSNKFIASGRHSFNIENACAWINQNVTSKKAKFMTSKSIFGAVNFYTEFDYENVSLHIFKAHNQLKSEIRDWCWNKDDKIIFIFPHQRFGGDVKRYQYLFFVFEKDLLNSLKTAKPDYLIVSVKESVFKLYLDKAKWAETAFRNDGVTIYKIDTKRIKPLNDFNYITSSVFKKKFEIFKTNYPDEYNSLEDVLSYFGLTDGNLIENTYENYQKDWVKKNIPLGAKIAYSYGTGECEIIEKGGYHLTTFNKDTNLASFQTTDDYLFIHNSRIRKNKFPILFRELKSMEPLKVFPQFFYFGDGWVIYKIGLDE